ncbi:isoaspartyl peptidase/L-asparaginase [Candidatus Thiodiazotropha endoloripes]|uniref:isoaspartyl peptidase/L-asparaginase n=1 Tax=Candidatus Thiodiazotropha endoloripes TaxID=1818881 RepID=UPI00269467B5|nr:isoaspartyl peptidase/L-asparaginase [Candidatus Thiodiazotropha endoloripes]
MAEHGHYSLMIHGSAGTLECLKKPKTTSRYRQSIRRILEHGRDLLELGGSALQTVESCASLPEDDPLFDAGCGSVLNEHGKAEMDAAIMDGRDLSAGAVAAVQNIANPIQLARHVMSKSEHVMLIAEGDLRFADQCGIEQTQTAISTQRSGWHSWNRRD